MENKLLISFSALSLLFLFFFSCDLLEKNLHFFISISPTIQTHTHFFRTFNATSERENKEREKYLNTNLAEMKNDYNRKCFVAELVFLYKQCCFCVANECVYI